MVFLDILLQSTVNGRPLTNKEVKEEVNTFIVEGQDTASASISHCLWLLSRHQEVQQKAYEELQEVFGNDVDSPIQYCDLQNLVYMSCIIKEALRMYPPGPIIARYLKKDCKIGM